VRRKEDPRLITGSSTYVDDLRRQGTGHMGILRSIYGHATINGIDASAAKALPGVIAVYTGAEFRAFTGPMPHGGGEGADGQKGQVSSAASSSRAGAARWATRCSDATPRPGWPGIPSRVPRERTLMPSSSGTWERGRFSPAPRIALAPQAPRPRSSAVPAPPPKWAPPPRASAATRSAKLDALSPPLYRARGPMPGDAARERMGARSPQAIPPPVASD
jgi:hypothetical protein